MHEAGSDANYGYTKSELMKFIIDADSIPVQRNSIYTKFTRFEDDDEKHQSAITLPLLSSTGD